MNEYPVTQTYEKEERLTVYHNYKSDVGYIILRIIVLGVFAILTALLIKNVISNTPEFYRHYNQITAKYSYILEGVPVAYMMESVNFMYKLVTDYILLGVSVINVIWCASHIVCRIRIGSHRKKENSQQRIMNTVCTRRGISLFCLRWNIVSFIVLIIFFISKRVIF